MTDQQTNSLHHLTARQRNSILLVAFLGWFFGGVQIGITGVAMRDAPIELMDRVGTLDLAVYQELQTTDRSELSGEQSDQLDDWNAAAARWFAWYQCAFLFGAAAGGFLFGRLGDQIGRTRSLAASIFCFSVLTGISYFAQTPLQLLVLRFLACIGIGGTWPNGVALVSEAWANAARPIVASSIGMAGNLGIFVMFSLGAWRAVTPDDWRWVMWIGASPVVLAAIIWFFIPESPTWLGLKSQRKPDDEPDMDPTREVFGKRYRGAILVGIALATIPLIGGWGSANWMIPWAGEAGAAVGDDFLKANVGQARSITSIVGSLLAGWIACTFGRRRTYALTSIGALLVAQYAFWFTTPTDDGFLIWVAILGFFNGIYFGWLPFFLPEMFDARVRSTGTGISFNSGRILTALTIFATGAMKDLFHGDYALIGRVTSWVFLLGVIAILFAPDTSKRDMDK
jgi:MFS family permease